MWADKCGTSPIFEKISGTIIQSIFNPGWRNHPNLSWRNNQNVMHMVDQVQPSPPQEKKLNLEDTMSELAKYQSELSKSQAQFVNETRTSL